jgi:hypothetical protein
MPKIVLLHMKDVQVFFCFVCFRHCQTTLDTKNSLAMQEEAEFKLGSETKPKLELEFFVFLSLEALLSYIWC